MSVRLFNVGLTQIVETFFVGWSTVMMRCWVFAPIEIFSKHRQRVSKIFILWIESSISFSALRLLIVCKIFVIRLLQGSTIHLTTILFS